jgi:putative ABC transport system permease protein
MGIPLVQGRFFTDRDDENAPRLAIINQTFARKYWGQKNVIGEKVQIGQASRIVMEIVGVTGDVKHNDLQRPVRPEIYVPYAQSPRLNFTIYVRTKGDPAKTMQSMRSRIWIVDKELPAQMMATMDLVLSRSLAPARASMILVSIFSGVALLLAMIGLYGVISHSVNGRIQEIGIRAALGARQQEIVRLVLGEGMTLTLLGMIAGIAAALLITRFLSGMLYGISALDPLTFATVSIVLVLTAIAACYFPARRASRIDPSTALKYE